MIRIVKLPQVLKEFDTICIDLNEGTRQIVQNTKVNGKPLDNLKYGAKVGHTKHQE